MEGAETGQVAREGLQEGQAVVYQARDAADPTARWVRWVSGRGAQEESGLGKPAGPRRSDRGHMGGVKMPRDEK